MLQQTGVKSIQDAVVVLHKMSADEKTRELAEMREKALHIEATEKSYARAEGEAVGLKKGRAEGEAVGLKKGRAEGRAEGERRKEAEILANLKSMGLSEEQIKQALGK